MCIICNCPGHEETADTFLREYEIARQKMKTAADAMLAVSKAAAIEHRSRYDGIHKEMVRQIKEWNKLEERREHATAAGQSVVTTRGS